MSGDEVQWQPNGNSVSSECSSFGIAYRHTGESSHATLDGRHLVLEGDRRIACFLSSPSVAAAA